ncbi:Sua5/YciO/YrdC/YwlC family protein [bacterium endosymbiont of Pedicinus badii]|uniref:Sua5/YciO/YrdC/YwlC family protein n=1 Tax=bacterium endosymbiont of Pedicinus badii TaxID=1719126 RepID=UPI0009BAE415|nr:Sua5/YciO/YrdC/YwlC family protein [bacterium endosymbiont of Pedicinus badii]OQM34128.1 hypothetical protein AOQ89_02175 [bacterium endosymbiont of Pedicinus badii]
MKKIKDKNNFYKILYALKNKKVIAYPSECVFALGCDPDCEQAVNSIISIKKRNKNKGFVLVSSNYEKLKKYVNECSISDKMKKKIFSTWPGNVTWTFPINKTTPKWIIGNYSTIAIRISAFDVIRKICILFKKPIISTSANISGEKPYKKFHQVKRKFQSVYVLQEKTGDYTNTSEIRNAKDGKILRKYKFYD